MKIFKLQPTAGTTISAVSVNEMAAFGPEEGGDLKVGNAMFPKGVRHPAEGLKPHKEREISYIIEGAFDVHLEEGTQRVEAGDLVVIEPGEAHATTALADSRVIYILQN